MTRIFSNNEIKPRLIELLLKHTREHKDKCLNVLNRDRIVFSTEEKCFLLTLGEISETHELETSQEEADTQLILHAIDLREIYNLNVTVCSPTGETDIVYC